MRLLIANDPRDPNEVINYISAFRTLGVEDVFSSYDPKKLEECDGLVLPGSYSDINPARWGEENVACKRVDDALDQAQWDLMDKAIEMGIPIIGMCRGIQFINVYFGGTLIQDLNASAAHRHYDPDRYHRVLIEPGSFLEELFGSELLVNSRHHQAVGKIGKGLKRIARWEPTEKDQAEENWEPVTTEALQHETYPIIGLQWHPERSYCMAYDQYKKDGETMLRYYIDLCRQVAEKRK